MERKTIERELQRKCPSCIHYQGYHFVREGDHYVDVVYCDIEKCHHEFKPERIRRKDPAYVKLGKEAAENRKKFDECERMIILSKFLTLAERLDKMGENKLKSEIDKELESATAYFIVWMGRTHKNLAEYAQHWETYLLSKWTDCGDWDKKLEMCMPQYPRRVWLWLWINFAETRTKQIFEEMIGVLKDATN